MISHRLAHLASFPVALREEGVPVDDRVDESELAGFGWAADPEGNRIERREPPPGR